MARPGERIRLKDRIIDNISKGIKSIQELVYYQYKDSVLAGYEDGVVLYNNNHLCHKLCENLDHTLLHGLKNVIRGYWRVVKQLSPHAMVREIETLANVTTDLGKGRAWLYASLNEGLLESYIRLLCDNDKLIKKYYAKEALVLDRDRMSVLLTLASGLDCVTFRLDYDVPFLDLNAYPPRSRSNSEQEGSASSDSSEVYSGHPGHYRSKSEVFPNSPASTFGRPSDSDSLSLASLDGQSHSDVCHNMKVSTISADSGFAADFISTNGTRQHSVASSEIVVITRYRSETPSDNASESSVASLGDPDKHQRLQSVVASGVDVNEEGSMLEVIRIKNKKATGSKCRKKTTERDSSERINRTPSLASKSMCNNNKLDILEHVMDNKKIDPCIKTDCIERNLERRTDSSVNDFVVGGNNFDTSSKDNSLVLLAKAASEVDSEGSNFEKSSAKDTSLGLQTDAVLQGDLRVDISCMHLQSDNSLASYYQAVVSDIIPVLSLKDDDHASSEAQCFSRSSEQSVASVEKEVKDLCYFDAADSNSSQDLNSTTNKFDFFPSGVGAATTSCSTPVTSNRNMAHAISSLDPASMPDKSDLMEGLNHQPNSAAQMQHNNSATSCHTQPDEDLVGPHKMSVCNEQKRIESDKIVTSEDGIEQNHPESSLIIEDTDDVYSSNKQGKMHNPVKTSEPMEGNCVEQTRPQCEDGKDGTLPASGSPPPTDEVDRLEMGDLSLRLDNNTVLQLMLDVFTREDEKFVKMFVTWENHTEGGSGVACILISDQCLYITHYQRAAAMFLRHSCTQLTDIKFISAGVNGQTLNIESRGKNKQKQRLWLTPGNDCLSRAILACLEDAVKSANEHVSGTSRFSIGSEVPLQKISLRKYMSNELCCKPQDVTLWDYSLVFWEDLSLNNTGPQSTIFREGTLHLRSRDSMRSHTWKQVYVILKNSMLFIKNDKDDPQPHSYLSLGGDQCVGCRMTSLAGRDNCVELLLSNKGSWFFSAVSREEISKWSHLLCLAVSQGTTDIDALATNIPCCAVLSSHHLFLCHENLYTKFYRTLARSKVEDVEGLLVDEGDTTYCIIKFKSQKVNGLSCQWGMYFYSFQDLERYKSAMKAAWKEVHRAELPVCSLEDISLQWHCRTNACHLKQQLTLS